MKSKLPEVLGEPRLLLIGVRMVLWRASLPLLKRMISLESLVRLLATSRLRQRDTMVETVIVRLAGRLWRSADGPCLERSLALFRELGLAGASPQLVTGIEKAGETFLGHAWVVVDGAPVLDTEHLGFVELLRFSASGVRLVPSACFPEEPAVSQAARRIRRGV